MLAAAIVAAPDDGGDRPAAETIFPTSNLYPAVALAAGEHGVTRVRVTYGADGTPACIVLHSTASLTLDRAACPILERRLPLAAAERRPAGTMRTFDVSWQKEPSVGDDGAAIAIAAGQWITGDDYPRRRCATARPARWPSSWT